MALASYLDNATLTFTLIGVFVLALTSLFSYLFSKPTFPRNAPPLDNEESVPFLGSSRFFTQRWDFYQRAMARSHNGNFSFYAGKYPVVALSGGEERKVFFEHKGLGFAEGYTPSRTETIDRCRK